MKTKIYNSSYRYLHELGTTTTNLLREVDKLWYNTRKGVGGIRMEEGKEHVSAKADIKVIETCTTINTIAHVMIVYFFTFYSVLL